MRVIGKRVPLFATSLVLVLASVTFGFKDHSAYAAQITNRTLTLQTGANGDGGSKPGGIVNHLFTFTVPTAAAIASIKFQYCTVASVDACVTPTGLDTTTATLGSEAGSAATGFTIKSSVADGTTNGSPYLTRAAGSNVNANSVLSFRLDHITNPSAVNTTFFVRISTYTSIDTSGTPIDTGSVAAATAQQILLTGTMPESIIFCTGDTIQETNGIPDCTKAGTGSITFNQLFSPTDTSTASSQMAASTNANAGYAISVTGTTLTSGTNTIPAMTTAAAGARGSGQFGLNLKANTTTTSTTPVGAEITPASNGTNFRGEPVTGYNTPDTFKFNPSGETIADSANGGTGGPTDSQIYTISYMVNVSGSQPAGTYTTTLTYICTATF